MKIRNIYLSINFQQKVQTNDDLLDIEVQTDEIEESNKWTQYPPEDSKGCGSGQFYLIKN